ncbi:MAG: hypothetical protein KJ956_14085, partial [Actinobacteria bacterium]|nr:hypothetical protein [Actinomycetota bacterium]
MKRLVWMVTTMLLAGLFTLGTAGAEELELATYGHPALEAINQAYENNEITIDEMLLYRLYFVKDPARLPAQFQIEGGTIRCAAMILNEIYFNMDGMSADLQEVIGGYRSRPYNLPELIITDHFYVHYTTSGGDACSASYAQYVADACETSYEEYFVQQNWRVPPGDGANGGGMDMIDCYIHDCGVGILGYAEAESPVPGGTPYDYTGYFHVDNAIGNVGTRNCTTAHEFMHVTQFGYNAPANNWYKENCAMIGEEWAFDSANDYVGYLYAWFGVPWLSLKEFNGQYEYGGIVWPMYTAERFNEELVEDIWEDTRDGGSIWDIFDTQFAVYGSDGHTAYYELMRWCFYTSSRDDHQHFTESGTWSAMLNHSLQHFSYPTGEKHPYASRLPEPYGTSIDRFNPDPESADNILQVTFDGPNCTGAVELIKKTGTTYTEYFMELDASGNGFIEIPDFDTCDYVFMMTSMHRSCNTAQDYAYWGDTREDASDAPELGRVVRVFPNHPNPFRDNTAIGY